MKPFTTFTIFSTNNVFFYKIWHPTMTSLVLIIMWIPVKADERVVDLSFGKGLILTFSKQLT